MLSDHFHEIFIVKKLCQNVKMRFPEPMNISLFILVA